MTSALLYLTLLRRRGGAAGRSLQRCRKTGQCTLASAPSKESAAAKRVGPHGNSGSSRWLPGAAGGAAIPERLFVHSFSSQEAPQPGSIGLLDAFVPHGISVTVGGVTDGVVQMASHLNRNAEKRLKLAC